MDTETRHGHKTAARGFDGYKGHIGIDPDSEIITATEATAGNAGDASAAENLIADLLDEPDQDHDTAAADSDVRVGAGVEAESGTPVEEPATPGQAEQDQPAVYGDNAYGTGPIHDRLEQAGIESKCKSQQPVNAGGRYPKSEFDIDLDADTVTCPAGNTAPIRRTDNGAGIARFGAACADCPLREQCTTARNGRSIMIGVYEQQLAAARARQRDPGWVEDYRATRPKVERKLAHLMRRRHGGRRARVRGRAKVAADFALLAAAVNLARLATLAVAHTPDRGWTAKPR